MPDFRVAETAPEHPKLRAAGIAAAGLWSMAGAYSMGAAQLTDGWVPDHWVQAWPGGKKAAAKLVEVGLWMRETRRGMSGYRFHDWHDVQRSVSQIEDERAAARERARKSRSKSGRTSGARSEERAPHVPDSLSLSLSLSPDGDIRSSVPDLDGRAAPPDRSAIDATATAVRERLQSMTNSKITEQHAAAVVAQILEGASGEIRRPTAYVLGAIDRDADPRRFLPTPVPPRYVAGNPV